MAENNNAPVSAHLTAEDYGLTTPVASEGGVPAYSGGGSDNDYGITTPVAPEGGIPAYPGSGSNNVSASQPVEGYTFSDTITITVPFNAGSNTDSQIRFIQPYLEKHLGVNTVIVNAGGASPAAPYVILSFLFEIMVEFMFLVCDMFICYASSHD